MQDEPTSEELIKAVADFLRNDIVPAISGHNAFKLRVSINALDLVLRQLALQKDGETAEASRLSRLLGMQGSLGELNRLLAEQIASGEEIKVPKLCATLSIEPRRLLIGGKGRTGRVHGFGGSRSRPEPGAQTRARP